jgi:threonine/homoserine/homoserine lactone efflux protein
MTDFSYWIVFFCAALVLNLVPGPDLIYILSRTVAQGARIGVASSLGVCTGALFHVLAAVLGLSAILTTSALAFSVVKYLGAAYLIYLGILALRSGAPLLEVSASEVSSITPWSAFCQAVLVDILNPKVAIFFMAFLPQFVRAEMGHPALQIVALGLLVIFVGAVVELSLVFMAARATRYLRGNARVGVWLGRLLGSIFLSLGVRLVLSERTP